MIIGIKRSRRRAPAMRVARRRRTSWRLVVGFVGPSLLVYGYFFVVPFVGSIQLSFVAWNGFGEKTFVGLANYAVLLQDGRMWNALSHNLIWAVIGTVIPIMIALPLAIIVWSGMRFRLAFRAIYFAPFVLPAVVVGIAWGWIYNPLFGVLNRTLEAFGLGSLARGWLGHPDTALLAVLVTAIWATFGFVFVIFLAALQSVDMNLVDAAKVDGAGPYQRARHVLLPQIAPVVTFVTAITLIGAFSVFDIVYVMTLGGPGTATEVLAGYTYLQSFQLGNFGYGAALSMVMTALSLVLTILFVRFRDRNRGE